MNNTPNIIEIGASPILDVIQTKSWTKLFDGKAPKWGLGMYWKDWINLKTEFDVVIISMGSKNNDSEISLGGFMINPHESPIWNSCVSIPSFILNGLLDAKDASSKMLIVYLDSLSSVSYKSFIDDPVEYSVAKSAMGTFLKGLSNLHDNVKVVDIMLNEDISNEDELAIRILGNISDAYEYFDDMKSFESYVVETGNELN